MGLTKSRIFYGWWIVTACFVLCFYVGTAVFWGFTAFFEPLVAEFQWSYAQVSLAVSLRGLEMGLLAPIVGFMVDRFGARKLILTGVICISLGLFGLSRTTSLAWFYGCFLVLAFGAGGCTTVVTMSVVASWFNKRLGIALGFMASGFGASGLGIPAIVGLVDAFGWRTTLVILSIGMLVVGLPVFAVIRNRPEDMGLHPDGLDPTPVQTATEDNPEAEAAEAPPAPLGLKKLWLSGSFIALMGAEFVRMLIVQAVGLHIMPYLGQMGYSRGEAGFVAASVPLISIIGRFGFGYLGDVMDKRRIFSGAFILMAVGLLAFYNLPGWMWAGVFLICYGPGLGGGMVMRGSLVRECFGRAYFGRLMGIVMAAAAIGGLVGPWAAGLIFDIIGRYQPIWIAFAMFILISGVLAFFIKPLVRE